MTRHGTVAIEVGEHERRRVGVRHDHLRNQRGEYRQDERCGQRTDERGRLDRQPVELRFAVLSSPSGG